MNAPEFLPENKDKKKISKYKDFDFRIRQMFDKNTGKNKI